MLKKAVKLLRGSVCVRAKSAYPERMLNLCSARGIEFWDVNWLDAATLSFCVARGDLRALRRAAGQIADAPTRQKALDLTATGEKMYRYLCEKPEKIPAAHQFLSYYLDTVGRILAQYVQFQNTGLTTDEIVSFQRKVRALLPKLKKGFDEQWTQLMASERFDVEADMAVVSQLLHTEGLTWETKADESA